MKREDIAHLANLARIKMTEEELVELEKDLPAIVSYVSEISTIAGNLDEVPDVGPLHNVFREDKITNEPEEFTKDLLAEMPETDGRYMKVKKILKQDT